MAHMAEAARKDAARRRRENSNMFHGDALGYEYGGVHAGQVNRDHFGQGMVPQQEPHQHHRRPAGRVRDPIGNSMVLREQGGADPAAVAADGAFEREPRRRASPKVTPKITGAQPVPEFHRTKFGRRKYNPDADPDEWYAYYREKPKEPPPPPPPPPPKRTPEEELEHQVRTRCAFETNREHACSLFTVICYVGRAELLSFLPTRQAMIEAIQREMEVIEIQMRQLDARRQTLGKRLSKMLVE